MIPALLGQKVDRKWTESEVSKASDTCTVNDSTPCMQQAFEHCGDLR
jgi:hypothetical protein